MPYVVAHLSSLTLQNSPKWRSKMVCSWLRPRGKVTPSTMVLNFVSTNSGQAHTSFENVPSAMDRSTVPSVKTADAYWYSA